MEHRITAVLLPLLSAVIVLISLTTLLPAEAKEQALFSPPIPTVVDEILECTGTNLLTNPSFEGDYPVYVMDAPGHADCQTDPNHPEQPNQYCERARLAEGWHPFWRDNPRPEPWINIQPEYKPAESWDTPPRIHSGERGQQYFSFYSSHEAGMYQQITAVPGGQYCYSAWGHAWSANTSTPDHLSTDDHGFLDQKIGIDPTGGTDWQSPNIIWGDARMQYDEFGLFRVEAEAISDTITVFMHSRPQWAVKHNDVYWDDAFLSLDNTLSVSAQSMTLLAQPGVTQTLTQTVAIQLSPGFTWQAALDPHGTVTPSLSALTGTGSTDLVVGLTSAGLLTGTYTNTLTISANDTIDGPTVIPLQVIVVDDIWYAFLPTVLKP